MLATRRRIRVGDRHDCLSDGRGNDRDRARIDVAGRPALDGTDVNVRRGRARSNDALGTITSSRVTKSMPSLVETTVFLGIDTGLTVFSLLNVTLPPAADVMGVDAGGIERAFDVDRDADLLRRE